MYATSNAIHAIDLLLTATDRANKTARTIWKYLHPILMVALAIAIVLALWTYESGQAFGRWCDRLVEASIPVPTIYLLAPAPAPVEPTAAEVLLTEWREKAAAISCATPTAAPTIPTTYYLPPGVELDEDLEPIQEPTYTLRELRAIARGKVPNANRLKKDRLMAELRELGAIPCGMHTAV
jgi:hypothetical protein